MTIDHILRLSQEELFETLLLAHRDNAVSEKASFILVTGASPVLLVAHLDTVHEKTVKTICRSDDGNILMSPEGIGGDDRCGVYALETVYKQATVKPWLLYTCDEEIGGIGAELFAEMYEKGDLPENIMASLSKLKLIIELDRKGGHDAVYYNCDNADFEKYITSKGFQTEWGSFSDISFIAPALGISAVNLSSGYYNAHTQHEFINLAEMNHTIQIVLEIVNESTGESFPTYRYKSKPYCGPLHGSMRSVFWNDFPYYRNDTRIIPDDLSPELATAYEMLLDIYSKRELENLRKDMGDDIIATLYEEEYGEPIEPCQTEKSKRRSPLSDISYNAGQELLDEFTGRTHHRQHTDGTVIIATDVVSADARCPYGDSSVPSARRRERMYHELYMLNKVNSERIYWKTVVALPEQFDDGQLTETAHKIALSFSNYLGRPVDYSVHRKPAGKNKDKCHIHFAVPERKYTAGKWSQKSTSYYINKDGTVNYEKRYKDENGNDVREPRTKNGEKPVYATDEKDGHEYCVNQVRDSNGRRKWKLTNIEGVTPDNLAWMHEEIDRIQNEALKKYGIDDKVKRNDKRTTRELKEAGVKAVHIGKRDNEAKGKNLREKIERNERYKKIANAFNEGYKKLDESEKQLANIEKEERKAENSVDSLNEDIAKAEAELQQEKVETEKAIIHYIEDELRPDDLYANMVTKEYEKAVALVNKNLTMLKNMADNKINAIDKVLSASIKNASPTEKDTLVNKFIITNRRHWNAYRNATTGLDKASINKMKNIARKKWSRYPGWKRCEFVKQNVGNQPAFIYKEYLRMRGELEKKPTRTIGIKIVSCEEAVASVFKDLPKLRTDKNKSAIENAEAITAQTIAKHNKSNGTELFHPPVNADILTLWHSIPSRMLDMTAMKEESLVKPLKDYHPEKDKAVFESNMKLLLDKQASQTNTEQTEPVEEKKTDKQVSRTDIMKPEAREEEIKRHREEYDHEAKLRQASLVKLRAETAKIYAEIMYKKEVEVYKPYLEAREPLDLCKENLEAVKRETPNNYIEIRECKERYERLLKSLQKRYPDHPLREPNILINQKEADAMFQNLRADLVKKRITEQNLPVQKELIEEYDRHAIEAQRLWEIVQADTPSAQGDGKQAKQKDMPKAKSKTKPNNKEKGKLINENTR